MIIILMLFIATLIGALIAINSALEDQTEVHEAEIYTGTEDLAYFLIDALKELELGAEYEVFTIDGEYHVQIKI